MDAPITYVANMLVVGGSWSAEEAIIGLPYCDVEPLITLTTQSSTTFSQLSGGMAKRQRPLLTG